MVLLSPLVLQVWYNTNMVMKVNKKEVFLLSLGSCLVGTVDTFSSVVSSIFFLHQ